MLASRRLAATILTIAVILAAGIVYGDYRSASDTSARLDQFEHQVCVLATNGRRGDADLRRSILLLASRAHARELIDRASGLNTAAQADADSELLYKELAGVLVTPTGPPLGCN